jgi:hypothetical protein
LLGGGRPGNQLAQKPPEASGDAPPGDEPNLQYARKAADLALEYLKDHQRNPDPQLLKELSWTPEDWKQFLARWERLKRLAGEQGGAGKRELDESLRSLGLQPAGDKFRRGGGRADQLRGLRDSGGRSAPPPAYQELFDAYRKGAARSSDE